MKPRSEEYREKCRQNALKQWSDLEQGNCKKRSTRLQRFCKRGDCGIEFWVIPSESSRKYCSRRCSGIDTRVVLPISEETRRKLSIAGKKQKWNEESRRHLSEAVKRNWSEGKMDHRKPNVPSPNNLYGKRTLYRGIWFRSRIESRTAKELDRLGILWLYEPKFFRLSTCGYLPDFYLPLLNLWIEVKFHKNEDTTKMKILLDETDEEMVLVLDETLVKGCLEDLLVRRYND